MTRSTVLVAMSGGVDSSVAAACLVEGGWDVVGVTMKLWGGPSDTGCCSVSDVDDARRVAQQLAIDHHVFNFGDDFERHVVAPYVEAHRVGRTPNPCIACNRHLKFDRLLRRASQLGIEAVATGHHARVVGPSGARRVARGADRAKDQSYVVHVLDQEALARVRFPVGDLTKAEVRRRAGDLGLRTAEKPDSQDVCFVTASRGRQAFLADRLPLHTGVVVDTDGHQLGEVPAVELVTVGQRRGVTGGGGTRRYVVAVDVARAVVTVGSPDDLLVDGVVLDDVAWAAGAAPAADLALEVLAQCSAHGEPRPAVVDGEGRVRWASPQRRVAPGQAVVLYDLADERVIGAGVASFRPLATSG